MIRLGHSYYSKGRKRISVFGICRDILIANVPERLGYLVRPLLPYEPDFIFFTHPRNEEDIVSTLPFVEKLSAFLPKRFLRWFLNLSPCYVVAHVKAPSGKKGYVISVTELPERLFASRQLTLELIRKSLSFIQKISRKTVYVGLAAWWPIVSNSGLIFEKYSSKRGNVRVTSGHTATLASIYLSTIRAFEILGVALRDASILIVGVGKVGGALCDLFAKKVRKLGLVDKNPVRLQALRQRLEGESRTLEVNTVQVTEESSEDTILNEAQAYDLVICTTSNTGLLVSNAGKLRNCIVLDDSRPEAFPRVFSAEKRVAILEGGLMKVPGVSLDSDFGFGKEENIFGCLSEAIILALDGEKSVRRNVGEVDYDNLFKLIEFCSSYGITVGDFKCGHKTVTAGELSALSVVNKQNA